jgi:uncharacterized protein YndB with AHSA1/START domain
VQHVRIDRYVHGRPDAVFDTYTDHVGWAEWGGLSDASLEREGEPAPNGVGCVRVFGPPRFAAYEEVLEFARPKRMTYRVLRGGIPIKNHFGEVDFEAEGDGTRIRWHVQFDPKIPGLGPILRIGLTRFFKGVLDGLASQRFPDP